MMTMSNRAAVLTSLLPIMPLLAFGLSGCGGEKEEAYGEIASIYAEVLVAQLMYGDDTVRRAKIVDSIVGRGGYESIDDLYGKIAAVTADDPRGVRILLDSTQARLEEMRDRKKKTPNESSTKERPADAGIEGAPAPSDTTE